MCNKEMVHQWDVNWSKRGKAFSELDYCCRHLYRDVNRVPSTTDRYTVTTDGEYGSWLWVQHAIANGLNVVSMIRTKAKKGPPSGYPPAMFNVYKTIPAKQEHRGDYWGEYFYVHNGDGTCIVTTAEAAIFTLVSNVNGGEGVQNVVRGSTNSMQPLYKSRAAVNLGPNSYMDMYGGVDQVCASVTDFLMK